TLPIVNFQMPIFRVGNRQSTIGNRQSAIGRPTRYREVVLTSWDRGLKAPQAMKNEKFQMENGKWTDFRRMLNASPSAWATLNFAQLEGGVSVGVKSRMSLNGVLRLLKSGR